MPEVITPTIDRKRDDELIQEQYHRLLRSMRSEMDESDRENIQSAFEIAVRAHSKQRRKSGEPYILHPIEVARICAEEIGLGPTAIIAALLHDTVEDTDVTLAQIHEQFGDRIALIVDGLTKLDYSYNAQSPQAENFKKVLRTLLIDVRVVLIKIADRLHNMRTLGAMKRHKQLKIAAETSYIYAPLAHRLGLYTIKSELLDLCMKITDNTTYKEVARKLNETKRSREQYISEFIEPLRVKLDDLGVPYRITGRPKSIYSIWNKIKSKEVPFDEIYDLFAIRIVVDVPPEKEKRSCWDVYSAVTDIYRPIPARLKDYVSNPKANGYESLHTTVVGPDGRYVEVQIRTERMNDIAERGFAAHWKYKGVSPEPNVFNNWLNDVRDILDNPNAQATEMIKDFKTSLFDDGVYVYTPKGDVVVMPKGASALDFAFQVHSDVGYHCTAIKVNKKLVPMGYKLRNGDQVQVITKSTQKPNESWLKLVVTGKARSKIRSAMKEERRKQGALGKETLERKLRHVKVELNDAIAEQLSKYFNFQSHVDLYFAIAQEQLTMAEIWEHFKVENGKLVELPREKPAVEPTEISVRRPRKQVVGNPKLFINDEPADSLNYQFANCCAPVQGDEIFAFIVSGGGGMKIHRSNCPNARNLMANYGYRILKAEWAHTTNTHFVADLEIRGVDTGPGIIEQLMHKVSSELGFNIRSFTIKGNEGYFQGKLSLLVSNTDQLYLAIKSLEKLDNVSSVRRVE